MLSFFPKTIFLWYLCCLFSSCFSFHCQTTCYTNLKHVSRYLIIPLCWLSFLSVSSPSAATTHDKHTWSEEVIVSVALTTEDNRTVSIQHDIQDCFVRKEKNIDVMIIVRCWNTLVPWLSYLCSCTYQCIVAELVHISWHSWEQGRALSRIDWRGVLTRMFRRQSRLLWVTMLCLKLTCHWGSRAVTKCLIALCFIKHFTSVLLLLMESTLSTMAAMKKEMLKLGQAVPADSADMTCCLNDPLSRNAVAA